MTERELIKKLNNLKNLKPATDWKVSQREILLSQVENTSGDYQVSSWGNFWMVTRNVFGSVPQFAWASMAIVIFLTTGLIWGNELKVAPNNSLYIARVISEKARLNTTFDSAAKNRLARQYASEHARDIVVTLSNPEFTDSEDVAKLNENFKTEIAKVRENLPAVNPDDAIVTIADSEKATSGVMVYDPNATTSEPVAEPKDAKVILEEAEKLFNEKDYSGALDKLNEAEEIIR